MAGRSKQTRRQVVNSPVEEQWRWRKARRRRWLVKKPRSQRRATAVGARSTVGCKWNRRGACGPAKQPRGRLWQHHGSCVWPRPMHPNPVWNYGFVSSKTYGGRTVRILNPMDEHSRECPMVWYERRWSNVKVIEALVDVVAMKGVPEHFRFQHGPDFVGRDLRQWLAYTGAKTLYIEPASPWESGYCGSFNLKLQDEFLNGVTLYSLLEIRVLPKRWRVHYNTVKSHSALRYDEPQQLPQCNYLNSDIAALR